jgi:diguanylate cyclase (GGDEF)-like protein
MGAAPKPANEDQRLAALRALEILDTPAEPGFDRVTNLVSRLLDVPMALVSFIDVERQWFKSCIGIDVSETAREHAFCAHAILAADVFEVPDATRDDRFRDNPLVTGAPYVRAYVGAPLVTREKQRVGTLCAIDTRPRDFTPEQLASLVDLAAIVVDELELRRMQKQLTELARTDELTKLPNRRAMRDRLDLLATEAARGRKFTVTIADIDFFKKVNDTHGHGVGDEVLVAVATALQVSIRKSDLVARMGGEEFCIVQTDVDPDLAMILAERLRLAVAAVALPVAVTASFGVVHSSISTNPDEMLELADAALYRAKANGRNRVERAEK